MLKMLVHRPSSPGLHGRLAGTAMTLDVFENRKTEPENVLLGPRAAVGASWSSIQEVPNLSRDIANRFAKKVFSIFMKICPPSDSTG